MGWEQLEQKFKVSPIRLFHPVDDQRKAMLISWSGLLRAR